MTLNRCLDVMAHTLPIAGRNSDGVAQWAANFYVSCFHLAAGLGNQNYVLTALQESPAETLSDRMLELSIAAFGLQYARFLWDSADSLTSASSKAVLLSRILAYLGWDLNADHKRREKGLAQSLLDIYEAQHSPSYNRILESIERQEEPRSSDLARLRSDVNGILAALPGRLIQSGVKLRP
jgi:hypothetical protein